MYHAVSLPNTFTPEECGRIIDLGAAAEFRAAALVGGQQHDNIRRARITWLDDQTSAAWIMQRIVDLVATANRTYFNFTLTDFSERLQLAHYDGDQQGHFDWHSDIGDGPLARQRKLTVVVQISDPDTYQGGGLETNSDAQIRTADRARGSATLFPSFVLHRVDPVTSGDRYSLTTWVHGPAFR